MAYEAKVDADLKVSTRRTFAPSVTRVGLRRNAFLRRFAYDFIVMFAPSLKRTEIEEPCCQSDVPDSKPLRYLRQLEHEASAANAELIARYADGRERLKLTWLLAALSMLGPFSIDTYLPAFPAMEAALPATEMQMQLTLTVYFIGFAIVSLFHGAISDSIGRKPVILGTIAVHALGSAGCALAQSIESLLAFRAAGLLCRGWFLWWDARSLRDLFAGDEAQRQLSRIQMLFAGTDWRPFSGLAGRAVGMARRSSGFLPPTVCC